MASKNTALIAGISGIVGLNLAEQLLKTDSKDSWSIYGLSRRKPDFLPDGVQHIACDLLDAELCKKLLSKENAFTHIFYCTWQNKLIESENCKVNGKMLENLLEAVAPSKLKHVVLVTGLKHYLGPFDARGNVPVPATPFKETMDRLPGFNFYYTLEDILWKYAEIRGFNWSIPRPSVIIGFAPGNLMNAASTIAVYATICRHLNLPFTFPGSKEAYTECLYDSTDAKLLADHIIWEVTEPKAANKAYNVVNGDLFRYESLWRDIGSYFELEIGKYKGHTILQEEMDKYSDVWDEIVQKHGLKKTKLSEIATWWLVDGCIGGKKDSFADMTRSRELGYATYVSTPKSYFKVFARLQQDNYIPRI